MQLNYIVFRLGLHASSDGKELYAWTLLLLHHLLFWFKIYLLSYREFGFPQIV
jgi:hypothetical protein